MERFDHACARYDTGIKAVYLLWRRAKWSLLRDIFPGVSRAEIEEGFRAFGGEKIRTEAQVFGLVQAFPRVMDAAIVLVGTYQILYFKEAA